MSNNKEQNPLQEEIFKSFKQFFEFRKFWNTRKAILRGVPLYDWNSSELNKSGYLNHWSFNIQENTFAALPVIFILKVLDFLFDKFKDSPPSLSFPDEYTKVFYEVSKDTDQFFFTFFAPTVLTFIVFLQAWSSLKGSDSTPETRARARRAYLYFDGAYGFYFQILLSLVYSLQIWSNDYDKLIEKAPTFTFLVFHIIFMVGTIGQILETGKKVPNKLFKINGYSSRERQFWQRKRPDDPPWCKYHFACILGGWPVIIGVFIILFILSYITATVLASIKMLFV
jgi:hypothetical protein